MEVVHLVRRVVNACTHYPNPNPNPNPNPKQEAGHLDALGQQRDELLPVHATREGGRAPYIGLG